MPCITQALPDGAKNNHYFVTKNLKTGQWQSGSKSRATKARSNLIKN